MRGNMEVTSQLKTLINGTFLTTDAMRLIRMGADPETLDNSGDPLLHILSQENNNENGYNNEAIEELVTTYHVNIDILNANGFTPLQCLISNTFTKENAMKLVHLGANPDIGNKENSTLLQILSFKHNNLKGRNNKAIKELGQVVSNYYKRQQIARNHFLSLLLMLVSERNNTYALGECSHFKSLPIDMICHIISFLDFKNMGKIPTEGIQLTLAAFSQHQKITKMAFTPGGINVFQRDNTFTFFKSVHTLCRDFEKLQSDLITKQKPTYKDKLLENKLTIASEKTLGDFTKKYAVSYWRQHSSLYENRKKLRDSIKNSEPFNKPEIQNRLR